MRNPTGKPCGACPFRVKCAPGWLGSATPEEFIDSAGGELAMPCHLTVDYSDPAWETRGLMRAVQCSGRAIYLGNICKRPRSENVIVLPANRELVFANRKAFLDYHTATGAKRAKLMKAAGPDANEARRNCMNCGGSGTPRTCPECTAPLCSHCDLTHGCPFCGSRSIGNDEEDDE